MINTAHLNHKQTNEEQNYIGSVTQLRLLRKRFVKQYIKNGRQPEGAELSALLLYFALFYIEQKIGFGALTSDLAINKKAIRELADDELAYVGNQLFVTLQSVLPIDLAQIMVIPNIESWHAAKLFFAQRLENALFDNITNLGFAYQIFCSGKPKQNALRAIQKANKTISHDELIAFTQLYTPDWVVDFLVANTLLPAFNWQGLSTKYGQWLIDKGLSDQNDRSTTKSGLENLTILDPACGTGQFLLSSFDLLQDLYRQIGFDEQISLNLILSKNLYGADIDGKALWVAGLGLLCKCLVISKSLPKNKFNLYWLRASDVLVPLEENSFLGSIDRRLPEEHVLKQSFQIILTNPPYIGRKSLSRELKIALKEQYPYSSADLAAAFMERCAEMLMAGGRLGVITQSSLMTIPSYLNLRKNLFENYSAEAMVRCGPGVFPLSSGEKIDSVLFVLKAARASDEINIGNACLIDLSAQNEKSAILAKILADTTDGAYNSTLVSYVEPAQLLNKLGGTSCLSTEFLTKVAELPKLCDIAKIKQGMATTDNAKFVRYSFDVDPQLLGTTWVSYVKGAGSERYASTNPFVVKWGANGQEIKEAVAKAYPYLKGKTAWVVKNEQYYFRAGLCFSFVNKTNLAVRRLPADCIFDVASSAIFAKPEDEDFLLAYLNSQIVGMLVKNINQSINIQVGDLKKLPIFPFSEQVKQNLTKLGREAFLVKEKLLQLQEVCLTEVQTSELSEDKIKSMMMRHINEQQECKKQLDVLQANINKQVIKALEEMRFIEANEVLRFHDTIGESIELRDKSKWIFDQKTYAYKLLIAMVARVVARDNSEHVVLLDNVSKGALCHLFKMENEVADFLEQILGISIDKIFSQSKILDINKLAQEPSRYFSIYIPDENACIFLSSLALRSLNKVLVLENKSILDIFTVTSGRILRMILDRLPEGVDWTSKDLFYVLKSSLI